MTFSNKSVMGRLWHDHFKHLGHPPKNYRVQDASFIDGSSSWWQISVILKKIYWEIIKNNVFHQKWHKKSTRQGCWSQKSGVGMHQNPPFQWKPMNNWKNPEINPRSTIEICPYFWVCMFWPHFITFLITFFDFWDLIQFRRISLFSAVFRMTDFSLFLSLL